MVKDPVCGTELDEVAIRRGGSVTSDGVAVVNPQQGTRQLHDGRWYYFCGIECRSAFMGTPEKFIAAG